jgi:hypothetical protein
MEVSEIEFRERYDSPASLPGKKRWTTRMSSGFEDLMASRVVRLECPCGSAATNALSEVQPQVNVDARNRS